MRPLVANIEEVFREAAARWTLIAYFILSSLFILLFSAAVNLDIVDGALAGVSLFGNEAILGPDELSLEKLMIGFESGFSAIIFIVSVFLAIFATAHLVPRLQDKGTVDLYLSRPVGRVPALLYRYIAGLLLAGINVVYLIGTIWLVLGWKTGVFHLRFLGSALVIMLVIAILLAFTFMVGTVTSSTGVSIMSSYALYFITVILSAHDKIAAAVSSEVTANIINGLYWTLPKLVELQGATIALVAAGQAPEEVSRFLTLSPFMTSSVFGVACLAIACVHFSRKEF